MNEIGTSVVIPVYNEAKRIPTTIRHISNFFTAFGGPYEIIIVDDNSQDSTSVVVRSMFPECILIVNDWRIGKGLSIGRGVVAARYPNVLLTDADLAVPIESSVPFLEHLAGSYDIVIGVRSQETQRTPLRALLGEAFTLLRKLLITVDFTDTQCGFKAFRRSILRELLQQTVTTGYVWDVEILYRAKKRGCQILEIPVKWEEKEGSHIRPIADSVGMLLQLLYLAYRIRRPGVSKRRCPINGHTTALSSHPDDSASWSPGLLYYGGKPRVKENAIAKKQALDSSENTSHNSHSTCVLPRKW